MSFGKRRTVTTPGGIIGGKIIFEQIEVNGSYVFAVKKDEGDPKIQSNFEVGEVIYYPLEKCPWKAPGEPLQYGSEDELYGEIRDFIYEHIDIAKDDRFYDVLSAWHMADWIPENFNNAPYLHFNGPPNSGKTRGLEIIQSLGFRPLLSPSVSAPALYRTIEVFKPTFLIDEAELYTAKGLDESKREVLSVLNAGYRRGQFVIRADSKGETLRLFDVFGFKALASVQPLPTTLAGRAIKIPMMRATRKVKERIDEEIARAIRSKLLTYRFNHLLEKPKNGVNPLDVPDGRIIEVFTPLILVAPNQKVKSVLSSLAREIYEDMLEEERTTEQAEVFFALLECLREGENAVEISEIVEKYNENRLKNEQISNSYCGRILGTLGFKKKRMPKTGRTAVILDAALIERLRYRYGVAEQKTLPTVSSGNTIGERETREQDELLRNICDRCGRELGVELHLVGGKEMWLCDKCYEEVERGKATLTKENMERVFETLANASRLKGSASTGEVAMEAGLPVETVKACLEALQREGRVYSPFPDWWKVS